MFKEPGWYSVERHEISGEILIANNTAIIRVSGNKLVERLVPSFGISCFFAGNLQVCLNSGSQEEHYAASQVRVLQRNIF